MTSPGGAPQYRRWRAPREHGERLIDPPLDQAEATLLQNLARQRHYQFELQGQPFQRVARRARDELLHLAFQYTIRDGEDGLSSHSSAPSTAPLILTGHQPELYHPGVWLKNAVASHVARRTGGQAVQLLIDNDLLQVPAIRVPAGTLDQARASYIDYDTSGDVVPHEERGVQDRARFESFADRVRRTVAGFVDKPLVETMWPAACAALRERPTVGEALAAARRHVERRWGLHNLELPFSAVCAGEPFLRFCISVMARITEFHGIYNGALAEYRRINRVRSRSHPVPALRQLDDWLESPFWVWSTSEPQRRGLFVRFAGRQLLLSDLDRFQSALPLDGDTAGDGAVQALLAQRGQFKIRPRALLTTMFLRLFLADLFIHGIGGAKYDQLTDVLIERFYGVQPPTFLVATGTARLPIDRPAFDPRRRNRLEQQLRDVQFHPERHVPDSPQTRMLISQKATWIHGELPPGQGARRHREITRINGALQAFLEQKRGELERAQKAQQELELRERLLGSREFSLALFPEETLQAFLLDI